MAWFTPILNKLDSLISGTPDLTTLETSIGQLISPDNFLKTRIIDSQLDINDYTHTFTVNKRVKILAAYAWAVSVNYIEIRIYNGTKIMYRGHLEPAAPSSIYASLGIGIGDFKSVTGNNHTLGLPDCYLKPDDGESIKITFFSYHSTTPNMANIDFQALEEN